MSDTTMRDHAKRVLAKQEADAAQLLHGSDADTAAIDQAAIGAEAERAAQDQYLTDPQGMRVDQALTMPLMLPVPRTQAVDWIMRNVVAQGAGTHICVGRLMGTAIKAEERETEWQGKKLKSILLTGLFRMQSALTDLMRENAELWLPNQYAKQVKAALDMGSPKVTFDIDIGVEATGRTIPYAWTVISHLRAKPSDEFERLWARRSVQPSLLAAPPAAA